MLEKFRANVLNRIKSFLSVNGETNQQNEKTYTSYSKMFNANDNSMNGTCNTYDSACIQHKRHKLNLTSKKGIIRSFFFYSFFLFHKL